MRLAWLPVIFALAAQGREPLAARIARTDPSKFRVAKNVHAGAGELHYMGLFDAATFSTNVIFLHRGVIPPGGGIGHHFHNHMEEMFVIFDGAAQFTVNGHTSLLQGPAGAPCRMGSSHAIYNPTDKPVQWMNIAVGSIKGKYDATDLGDDRVGVTLDPKPVFITMKLDKAKAGPLAGGPVRYRRVLQPEVFYTNWSYVDHYVVPSGAGVPKSAKQGVEEFWYVMSGEGKAAVGNETAAIKAGDAVPVFLGETKSFQNTGSGDLEMMVVGVTRSKWALE